MNGSVYRRNDTGMWAYKFDIRPDPLSGRLRNSFEDRVPHEEGRVRRTSDRHDGARARSLGEVFSADHSAFPRRVVRGRSSESSPNTWVNYRNYLDAYLIPVIGETAIQDLSPVRLNLLYSHLLERGRVKALGGLAPKTVQNVHRMLHRALRDAVRWDVLPRNAAEEASPPRARRPRPTVWTAERLGLFVDHVSSDRFYALWLLVATTGLRRGELAGLQRNDVDIKHRTVSPSAPRVVDGHVVESEAQTTSGVRNLALDSDTAAALEDYLIVWEEEGYLLGQPRRLLFIWPDGRPLHPDTITAQFHKHCEAAGLPAHSPARRPALLRERGA